MPTEWRDPTWRESASTTLLGVSRYWIAIVSVGLALAARFAVHPLVGDRQPFAFFYVALVFTTWLGGLGPGLFALALGFLAGDYFFIAPRYGLVPVESGDIVAAVIYLFVGSVIVAGQRGGTILAAREPPLGPALRHFWIRGLRSPPSVRYALGMAIAVAASLARIALNPVWGESFPFIFYFPATLFTALFGGIGPALAGIAICTAMTVAWIMPASGSPWHMETVDLVGLGVYVLVDVSIAWLGAAHRALIFENERQTAALLEREAALGSTLASLRTEQAAAQAARAEAEDRLQDVQSLVDVNRELGRTLDLSDLLPKLCRLVREIAGADGVTFVLREGDHVRYVAEDAVSPLWAGRSFPIESCISGWSILKHETAVIEDVYADPRIPVETYKPTFVQSLVMVPVRREGEFVGAIGAYWARPRRPAGREVALLEAVAGAASVAVANAQLFGDMRSARSEAEKANRAKDEFLAMLGHELRNPLSAVRNAVVAASLDESRRSHALEIARRQTDQLGRLIDDLLDVARITQGRVTLHKEAVYLREIIGGAVESTRSFIESRGVRLTVALEPDSIQVKADRTRLEQVFVNLLSNAAKYSDAGGRIDVRSERRGEEVAVHVRDTGIGIAAEMIPRIWDLFAQVDRSLDRAQGGLGIGLTVARRIVELHGGRIAVRSDGLGKGAEFTVTLSVLPATTEAKAESSEAPPPRQSTRVLVVEDHPDSAETLTMLLQLLGHRASFVHDGLAALDAVRAEAPDVMIVDIGLPGMDGYEVARRVREAPGLGKVLLVALTGYGSEEDKRRAMAAGFDYHLVKPVTPEALDGLVARLEKSGLEMPITVQ